MTARVSAEGLGLSFTRKCFYLIAIFAPFLIQIIKDILGVEIMKERPGRVFRYAMMSPTEALQSLDELERDKAKKWMKDLGLEVPLDPSVVQVPISAPANTSTPIPMASVIPLPPIPAQPPKPFNGVFGAHREAVNVSGHYIRRALLIDAYLQELKAQYAEHNDIENPPLKLVRIDGEPAVLLATAKYGAAELQVGGKVDDFKAEDHHNALRLENGAPITRSTQYERKKTGIESEGPCLDIWVRGVWLEEGTKIRTWTNSEVGVGIPRKQHQKWFLFLNDAIVEVTEAEYNK
jgi:hypothetical protein